LAAGIEPGDEVITPALNNIGDFQAIGMCGARPVFLDICEDDLGINPALIDAMMGPKVKAIIALHYTGVPCRIDDIHNVAQKFGIRVIEDAAHAIGTRWQGKMVGSYGDITCFSFDAIKTLTCIDGGVIVVPCDKEAEMLYPARLLGMTQSNERLYSNSRAYGFDVLRQGFRYHLANLHASIGLSQLNNLPQFILNRRQYARLYNSLLRDIPGVVVPQTNFDDVSLFNYVIRVLNDRRRPLIEYLIEKGIETGIHWLPGNRFTWLKNCRGADTIPVTDRIADEIITLPLWSYMDEKIIIQVTKEIRKFFGCL
jgi:dTDP-4-amino-4,6-dideoxygalactose transaminase